MSILLSKNYLSAFERMEKSEKYVTAHVPRPLKSQLLSWFCVTSYGFWKIQTKRKK